MRTTLRDVASEVGVSIKTVSRVVTGDPRVAPETAAAVKEAAARLGYQPNLAARSLRKGVHNTIGLIVDSVADPFFSAVVGAVEDACIAEGYAVLAASTKRDPERESEALASLAQRSVSGCIIVPATEQSSRAQLGATPVVYLDRAPTHGDADCVLVEDFEAAQGAVEHLIRHGHTRIAFVGDTPRIPTTRHRLEGYYAALQAASITPQPSLVRACCPTPAEALLETKQLLTQEDGPTAIFASGSRQASGVVSGMDDWQRQHIALVSFGDLAIADALRPALTVVDHDPATIAREAVRLLLRRIADPSAPTTHILRRLELIERGSGELPPITARKRADKPPGKGVPSG